MEVVCPPRLPPGPEILRFNSGWIHSLPPSGAREGCDDDWFSGLYFEFTLLLVLFFRVTPPPRCIKDFDALRGARQKKKGLDLLRPSLSLASKLLTRYRLRAAVVHISGRLGRRCRLLIASGSNVVLVHAAGHATLLRAN